MHRPMYIKKIHRELSARTDENRCVCVRGRGTCPTLQAGSHMQLFCPFPSPTTCQSSFHMKFHLGQDFKILCLWPGWHRPGQLVTLVLWSVKVFLNLGLLLGYSGDRGSTVVKVLCYKLEGCWFDSRWCHWNFSLT